jgi:hypothetical protein
MTRRELKQLIRETIEEQMIQEGMPTPKTELANEFYNKVKYLRNNRIQSPEHEQKVEASIADIIHALNDYEEKFPDFKNIR